MVRCPSCGEENPDRFRVCGYCGTPLVGALAPSELRKTVTILFSDLKGSTNLGERLDPESLREVLNRYFATMKRIIERHGGTIEKYIGDAIMAVFGIPRLHDDDALRAVRSAWEMKLALAELNEELQAQWGVTLANRTGVNTGQVVTGDATSAQRLVTGDTVNVAARLEQSAPECDTLIGESTWRLVRDAIEAEAVEPLALKGKTDRIPAFRLTGVRSDRSEGFTRRLDAPMVGRSQELAALEDAVRLASDERRCRIVTLLGHPGLGKTRLIEEFLARRTREAMTLRGRCLPYGEGITFWPLAEIARQAAGIAEDDTGEAARAKLAAAVGGQLDVAERLYAVTGLSAEAFPIRETFWAARKMIETLSRRRPLVVVFEDIHWAEPTFLDLVQHVVDTAEDAPALILCAARPELLDARPKWMNGLANAQRILLAPLGPEDAARVTEALLGRTGLPARLHERVTAAAEGNPLFVEQMVSMLVDEGALRPDGAGGWTLVAEPAEIAVPPTISALLSARLDQLDRDERTVIDAGSIPGPEFYCSAVTELSPEPLRPSVSDRLQALTEKLLIAPTTPTLVQDDAFRFQHILIREAAYDGLLKRTRADLHERYVQWLERTVSPSAMDRDELIGYHLERAYRYLLELAPADERARRIAATAADKLSVTGRRALARGDMPAAANLLQRAVALLAEDDPARLDAIANTAAALSGTGRFAAAGELLAGAITVAARIGDRVRELDLRMAQLVVRYSTDPTGWSDIALPEATAAIPVLEAAGRHAALSQAWRIVAAVHGSANRYGPAEEAQRRAVDEARLAGDRRLETLSARALALAALLGPTPVAEAIAICERLIEQVAGDQIVQSMVRVYLSQLRAMQGRFEAARELYASARSTLDDLGATVQAAATSVYFGRVELLAGDPARAAAILQADVETLSRLGEKSFIWSSRALLAEALCDVGRWDEALELTRLTERTAPPDDVDAQFRWRAVRARVLARTGHPAEALPFARDAVAIMRRTEATVKLGSSLITLSEVLWAAGDGEAATAAIREANGLFEAKGHEISAARARATLAGWRVEPAATAPVP